MSLVEDRLAIEDLFVRYTTALDAGDGETIVGCFTEDGVLDSPTVGTYTGREAIGDFARRFARFCNSGAQLRHMISNLAVTIEGRSGARDLLSTQPDHSQRRELRARPRPLRMRSGSGRKRED
jgi:hypothetical protein